MPKNLHAHHGKLRDKVWLQPENLPCTERALRKKLRQHRPAVSALDQFKDCQVALNPPHLGSNQYVEVMRCATPRGNHYLSMLYQVRTTHPLLCGERMIGCDEEWRSDHADGTRFYVLVRVRLFVSDSDLGTTTQQHGNLVVKQREQEFKLYIGETLRKHTQYRFQPGKMRGVVHRQRQSMLDPCRNFSRECLQVRTCFDDIPCIQQEASPLCRQRGISSASVKQRNPQVSLQIGDRRADDGLGLAEAPGGCGK